MVEKYSIRTDLALEQKERFEADNVEIPGVILEEKYNEEKDLRVTTVKIKTKKGAKTMRKPIGTYITIEAPRMMEEDEESNQEVVQELKNHLEKLVSQDKEEHAFLIVGLGNRKVTPDALGPYVVDQMNITRHIVKEYGKYATGREKVHLISAIVPGVMGQTGMETVEIVKGIVSETKPDFVIAIDALAARSSRRLNRTVQITDTGICPGSGVGNHRNAIDKEAVGVPVIAIGVPTVVDAATIVNDAMENLIRELESSEKYELVKELVSPHLNGMFVTPKDIDETVRRISYIISDAINQLFE